jgi:hypothetical protein
MLSETILRAADRLKRPAPAPRDTSPGATMTAKMARAILGNSRGMSDAEIEAAHRVIAGVQARNPGVLRDAIGEPIGASGATCRGCGSARWSLHDAPDGSETWGCSRCHMPPLTAEQWAAHQAARPVQAPVASIPAQPPREALAALLTALAEARTRHVAIVAGAARSREVIASARAALDVAEVALAEARDRVSAARVEALISPARGGKVAPITAEVRAVEDTTAALAAAEADRDTLDIEGERARDRVASLERQLAGAALDVVAAEVGDTLVAAATKARDAFIASIQSLNWLAQHGHLPAGGYPLMLCLDRSPSGWPDVPQPGAPDHGAARLVTALERLKSDAAAPIG